MSMSQTTAPRGRDSREMRPNPAMHGTAGLGPAKHDPHLQIHSEDKREPTQQEDGKRNHYILIKNVVGIVFLQKRGILGWCCAMGFRVGFWNS